MLRQDRHFGAGAVAAQAQIGGSAVQRQVADADFTSRNRGSTGLWKRSSRRW